jgi:hypothetical protein
MFTWKNDTDLWKRMMPWNAIMVAGIAAINEQFDKILSIIAG